MEESKEPSVTAPAAVSEKENASAGDQPMGVKFTYGIPGREVQNKNRLDMPPRSTNNTAPRGGGRGFGRGRGQSYDSHYAGRGHGKPGGAGRYQHQNHVAPPPSNGKPHHHKPNKYVKVNVNNNNNIITNNNNIQASCGICDRPCTDVVCKSCGYHGKNLRVKKECPSHPRVIRVQDLKVCPECKTESIEEKPEVQKEREKKEAEAAAANKTLATPTEAAPVTPVPVST